MAVTFDAVSLKEDWGSINPDTLSHTIGGGANRALVVGLIAADGSDITFTGVTYNGNAMSLIETDFENGYSFRVAFYWLGDASLGAAGAHDIVVTAGGVIGYASTIFGVSFAGATQTPPAACDNSTGTGTTASLSVTSAADGYVVDMMYYKDNTAVQTKGGSQTVIANATDGYMDRASSYAASAGASTDMTWTWTGSINWQQMGIAINPAAGGPTPITSTPSDANAAYADSAAKYSTARLGISLADSLNA